MKYCKDVTNLLFWELQECLTIPIKIIVSSCSKLSCLSRSKKSTSSLTFFLRYCKEIATLLLIAIWTCLIIFTQNNSIKLKEPLTFICGQKKSTLSFTLSLRYCRHCGFVVLGTLHMPGYAQSK